MTTASETNSFAPDLVASMPDAQRRRRAAETASAMTLPSTETEEWRYSRVGELDLQRFDPQIVAPVGVAPVAFADLTARAATVSVVNGWVTEVSLDAEWAERGLQVGPSTETEAREPRREVAADGSAGASAAEPSLFEFLHLAFAPDAVQITVPDGLIVEDPIVIQTHHASGTNERPVAAFPHVVVDTGANAAVTIVERQTSDEAEGLSVSLLEATVGSASRVDFISVQNVSRQLWQVADQRSTVADQANLTVGCASFGGGYSRVRTDTTLAGRGANGDLLTIYYADEDQAHDFRTFQHHAAQDTTSDLLFKGAVDDRSSSIYTGLIHIHPDGRGSNAHQTNRNVKLSEDAWAWSVPNLEIENNDVRCSHASTVSPVDEDQQFYLHARGVPPAMADRLVVAGFFEEVIGRIPVGAVQNDVRQLVAEKLDARGEA